MPNPLNNVVVPDQYSNAASILNIYGGRGGSFDIRAQPVFYQLQYGSLGVPYFTEEAALQPGSGAIEPGAIGVRFRNQVAGMAATVDARIAPPGQPLLTLTSSGAVTANTLTGQVAANGTVILGTGFTVNRTGAGVYVVSFTTPFAAIPTVGALIGDVVAFTGDTIQWSNASVSSVTFRVFTGGGVAQDQPFSFMALATQ